MVKFFQNTSASSAKGTFIRLVTDMSRAETVHALHELLLCDGTEQLHSVSRVAGRLWGFALDVFLKPARQLIGTSAASNRVRCLPPLVTGSGSQDSQARGAVPCAKLRDSTYSPWYRWGGTDSYLHAAAMRRYSRIHHGRRPRAPQWGARPHGGPWPRRKMDVEKKIGFFHE